MARQRSQRGQGPATSAASTTAGGNATQMSADTNDRTPTYNSPAAMAASSTCCAVMDAAAGCNDASTGGRRGGAAGSAGPLSLAPAAAARVAMCATGRSSEPGSVMSECAPLSYGVAGAC